MNDKDFKELHKRYKEQLEKIKYPENSQVCPHCGHCPVCGRRGWPNINDYPKPIWMVTEDSYTIC